MSDILNAFAGGISFAAGSLVGVSVIAYFMRAITARQMKELITVNKRIDDRLEKQVAALNQIADHIGKGGAR